MKSLDQIRKEVDELKDSANQKIDPEIKELIVGLRLHNIPTAFSCAGHKEKPWSSPYVDIYADDSNVSFEDYSEEMNQIRTQWIKGNVRILEKLTELLSAFYANRKASYPLMLAPHCSIDTVQIRLKSIGTDLLKGMNQKSFKRELKRYQKELLAFGTFLVSFPS